MQNNWQPCQSCALRDIIHDRVWLAHAAIVVKDEPEETCLLLLPGSHCAYPEGYWRWKHGDFSQGTRWQEARCQDWTHRQFVWQTNRMLMILEPEKYYACCLFWDHVSDQFRNYYINFQLPYQRSHCGFDTFDLELDLVVDADFTWQWKDRPAYEAGIQDGSIQASWAQAIGQAQTEIFDRLKTRGYPFDGSWLSWRHDSSWTAPCLPDGWQEV